MTSVIAPSARRGHGPRAPRAPGPQPPDRTDRAAEHVVAAAELAGPLDRDDVLRLIDDADYRLVAARVAADAAELGLGDVAADLAEPDLVLDLHQSVDQAPHVGGVGG